MRGRQTTILIALVVIVAMAMGGWGIWLFYPFDGTYHVRTLRIDSNRYIEIRADTFWEMCPAVYYQVFVDGQPLNDKSYLGCASPRDGSPGTLDLRIITARNGQLVAVVEGGTPNIILIMHDFKDGINWPRDAGNFDW